MDKIIRNTIVTLACTVVDVDGNVIEDGKEPLRYLHGGYNSIFLPVEAALHGKSIGDSVSVKLQPADAFGEYDPELVDIVSVGDLPHPLIAGMQIEGNTVDDADDPVFVTVTDIAEGKAVLDGNHPLAGTALIFACTVQEVRPATDVEIAAAKGKDAGTAKGGINPWHHAQKPGTC